MITCYACRDRNYGGVHICAGRLKPLGASFFSVARLADSWRAREHEKALTSSGEVVAYGVERPARPVKSFDSAASAIRFGVAQNSSWRLFLVRWWPRTGEGRGAARRALQWVSERGSGYANDHKKTDAAAKLLGPKFAVREEIPL